MRLLGLLTLTTAAALVLPGTASAQGATGSAAGDVAQRLGQMSKPMIDVRAPPSPLTRLRSKSRDWIAAETRRQLEEPREPLEVALEIDEHLGKDIARLARRERIRPDDIANAILLKIMFDADSAVRRRAASPDADHEALANAEARLREVLTWQSQVSRALAMM